MCYLGICQVFWNLVILMWKHFFLSVFVQYVLLVSMLGTTNFKALEVSLDEGSIVGYDLLLDGMIWNPSVVGHLQLSMATAIKCFRSGLFP